MYKTFLPLSPPRPLPAVHRMLLLMVAVFLMCGFGVAAFLTPSPAGSGTHQQLGLPPCFFMTVTGYPCPACGMTTCFAHFVRLEWIQASRANSGGILLAIVCSIALVWSLVSAIRGVSWLTDDYLEVLSILSLIVLGVVVANWIVRVVWIWL
ncbi:MAG: hypothetical protein C0478_14155 [Planctomyces sp.]|nr:hypothetical protein [Planctomyces sp.]